MKMVVTLEDDLSRELPTSIDLYRPIRQTIYSVLLNLNKLKIINDTQNKEKGIVFTYHFPTIYDSYRLLSLLRTLVGFIANNIDSD